MFAFSSIPVCRGGKIRAGVMDDFSCHAAMQSVSGKTKGYNILNRAVPIIGGDGTTRTEWYLSRFEDIDTYRAFYFPYNTDEPEEDECDGKVIDRDHGISSENLSWDKTNAFIPKGRLELSGAVPATYSIVLSISRYEAKFECGKLLNNQSYLKLTGEDVLTGKFVLGELDVKMKCGVNATVDLDFLLNPASNSRAPNWKEQGVAWDNPTLTLQCMG